MGKGLKESEQYFLVKTLYLFRYNEDFIKIFAGINFLLKSILGLVKNKLT